MPTQTHVSDTHSQSYSHFGTVYLRHALRVRVTYLFVS
jgi:hypothetical protein